MPRKMTPCIALNHVSPQQQQTKARSSDSTEDRSAAGWQQVT
jgi:hypothetical protein